MTVAERHGQHGIEIAHGAAEAAAARRYIVTGRFLPEDGPAAFHATQLVHMLREAGAHVMPATLGGWGCAPHRIGLGSHRRFEVSTRFLRSEAGWTGAIVYLDALLPCTRTEDPRRLGPLKRRGLAVLQQARYLARIARETGDVTLVVTPGGGRRHRRLADLGVVALLTRLSGARLRIHRLDRGPGRLVQRLTGARLLPPARAALDLEALFSNSAPDPRRRLHPRALEAALDRPLGAEMSAALRDDLTRLLDCAQRYPLDREYRIRKLAVARAPAGERGAAPVVPESHALAVANEIHPVGTALGVPLTRYMMHLRAARRLEARFPLTDRAEAERFLDWYLQKGAEGVPAHWIPVPRPIVRHLAARDGAGPEAGAAVDRILAFPGDGRAAPLALSPYLAGMHGRPGSDSRRFDLRSAAGLIGFAFQQLLRRATGAEDALLFGSSALEFLAERVGGEAGALSRFELLLALHCAAPVQTAADLARPWESEAIRAWMRDAVLPQAPEFARFSTAPEAAIDPRHRLDIAGVVGAETGLSRNIDMSAAAFRRAGLALRLRDAESGFAEVTSEDGEAAPPTPGLRLKRSVALHHANLDRIPQHLTAPVFAARGHLYNIGFLLWELDRLPEAHRLGLEMLDEVWAPTRFLEDVFRAATDRPVLRVGKGFELPPAEPFDLAEIGVPEGTTRFLVCFDFHSSVARKNPLAAVEAFLAAFPRGRRDVSLIVKTTPAAEAHWGDPEDQLGRIRALAAMDSRIVLLESFMPFRGFLGLIAAADVLVSPHRAEGFGYLPAYALSLGRSVVSTDFSGPCDFCTGATAWPVPFRRIPVPEGHAIFPVPGAEWAEIDRDALTETLRHLAERPDEAACRAAAGQALIRSEMTLDAQAARYRTRLAEIGAI
ncbi:MAG: glycosyltransferase [Pseudomonadota bacterium]